MNILPHLHIKVQLSVSVLISRSTVLEVYCYSMFATDTPQIGSRRLYPLLWVIWRVSYFSWLTLVLPAQLRLVPWKCHPLFSHLGASSSVAVGCCVSASPPLLVVDDPVYLGCVQFGSVLLLTTKGVTLRTFSPDT